MNLLFSWRCGTFMLLWVFSFQCMLSGWPHLDWVLIIIKLLLVIGRLCMVPLEKISRKPNRIAKLLANIISILNQREF